MTLILLKHDCQKSHMLGAIKHPLSIWDLGFVAD